MIYLKRIFVHLIVFLIFPGPSRLTAYVYILLSFRKYLYVMEALLPLFNYIIFNRKHKTFAYYNQIQ